MRGILRVGRCTCVFISFTCVNTGFHSRGATEFTGSSAQDKNILRGGQLLGSSTADRQTVRRESSGSASVGRASLTQKAGVMDHENKQLEGSRHSQILRSWS